MIRALVCGYGRFGRVYAQRVDQHEGMRLVGVVDSSPAAQAVALTNGRDVFTSFESALRYGVPDLVVIATPPLEHARLAVEAMTAGVDVMLAKPGAVGMDDADTICTVAWTKGRRVVVDYTPTESPEWAGVLRQTNGERIVTARFTRRGWVARQECGALWDLAPHDVALALQLRPADRVMRVTARGWWHGDGEPVGAWLHLEHTSGRVTRIEVDWLGVQAERRVEVITDQRTHVWDQLLERVGYPDNITRALDRALLVLRGAPDDTDRLREVTRILSMAEHSIYTAQEAVAA